MNADLAVKTPRDTLNNAVLRWRVHPGTAGDTAQEPESLLLNGNRQRFEFAGPVVVDTTRLGQPLVSLETAPWDRSDDDLFRVADAVLTADPVPGSPRRIAENDHGTEVAVCGEVQRLESTGPLGWLAGRLPRLDGSMAGPAAPENGRLFRWQRRPTWTMIAAAIRRHTRLFRVPELRFAIVAVKNAVRVGLARHWPGKATAIGAALRVGDPRTTLRRVELKRARSLNRRASRPPSDPRLHSALVELRTAKAELRDNKGAKPTTQERVTALEERVRHRAMLVDGAARPAKPHYDPEDVVAALGQAILLSIFSQGGQLYAVSVSDGDFRLHRLGAESAVLAEVNRLRYFLGRKAAESSLRVLLAYSQGARHAAEMIEARVLTPVLSRMAAGRPLVVIPTGRLHVLPWAELPSCRGRSVTVAPSLRCWLRGADVLRRTRPGTEHVWVSGPGLEHAEREVRALYGMSGGRLLVGPAATTEQVLNTVDGAGTAHIAAHGWFRDDQPQLSCLDLVDGPLYAYDFDRLRHAPTTVVLSACEVGQSAIRRGEELSGLAVALLGRGTATVISSVVPVPDERTAEVMLALHTGLRRGLPPAAALARAQAAYGESGFLCLGYGGGGG